ncbi:hypothetical protein VTI28DRAFT_4667 [Corynascus sepedonium]
MDITVSLDKDESMDLSLKEGPVHVYITIPFSFLVKDFDPNTTQVPKWYGLDLGGGPPGVVVLKANNSSYGTGGILFTLEEMDEKEKVAWKATWMGMVPINSTGGSNLDLGMTNKNHALYRHMSGWASRPLNEKGSVDSD